MGHQEQIDAMDDINTLDNEQWKGVIVSLNALLAINVERAETAEKELKKRELHDYLHEGDTLANATQFLADHPELDMVESIGTTENGEAFTLIILRGHQTH